MISPGRSDSVGVLKVAEDPVDPESVEHETPVMSVMSLASAGTAGDPVVIEPPKRFDIVSAPSIRTELNRLIDLGRVHIVVDLTEVAFMDSAGLAALVSGMKQARRQGGDLRLIAPANAEHLRIFDLTSLADVFVIGSDRLEVLEQW